MLNEEEKGNFHLSNGLRLNFNHNSILQKLFPMVWERKSVKVYITKHKK
jgi:hypothetical protein